MSQNLNSPVTVICIDIGKNLFHIVGLDSRGAMERSNAGVAADSGKRHVSHPGPKPVQVYRVQSW